MEVSFDPQDCEEVVEKDSRWSSEKLKSLWVSLLNLEMVSKACEDIELQGMLLLLETIFSIFRKLKSKHDTTVSSYEIMKHELDTTKGKLQEVKYDLQRYKNSSCERCPKLEKDLQILTKKLETNENRIKSIVSILSGSNCSEDSAHSSETDQHPAVAKAFNLMSQMLLGNEAKHETKRECQQFTGNKSGEKMNKVHKLDSVVQTEDKHKTDNNLHGKILIPESFQREEERNLVMENEPIPETLDSEEDFRNMIHNENVRKIDLTPEKKTGKLTEVTSPILGGSAKKTTCLSSFINSSPQEDSSDEHTLTYEPVKVPGTLDKKHLKSPSLLQAQSNTSNVVVSETDKSQQANAKKNNVTLEEVVPVRLKSSKENMRKVQADFWKLQSASHSSIEGRNRRLKQTTLSLACYPKKNDLSALKEFNGGVRQSMNESDVLADKINGDCDEETSLKLAIRESLNRRNVEEKSTEDDEDFVFKSPRTRRKRLRPKTRNLFNEKGDAVPVNNTRKKRQINSSEHKDTDETFFVPLFTSTMKDHCSNREEIPESPDISSGKLLEELAKPAGGSQQISERENSFDRIPERIPTSPNYKYRRNAVRKKEERQKLDGWECEQCKNYYGLDGENLNTTEMKKRLKLCSKHRDKFSVQSTTPPGYWDIKLLDTEMTRVEDKIK